MSSVSVKAQQTNKFIYNISRDNKYSYKGFKDFDDSFYMCVLQV